MSNELGVSELLLLLSQIHWTFSTFFFVLDAKPKIVLTSTSGLSAGHTSNTFPPWGDVSVLLEMLFFPCLMYYV